MKTLNKWIIVALTNLAIVALLGFTLRAKMIFSIPFIDFKYLLHAHSHFAFGGWVTLALLALLTYRLLPAEKASKPIYKWMLLGLLLCSYGMLFSFPFQGYGMFSIGFSTLFIFFTYGYAFSFIRDINTTQHPPHLKMLAKSAVIYMALSSVGAFTLAYMLATKSSDVYLYKDAIYTYLHLQYSGFFTLSVISLLLHYLQLHNNKAIWFARLLNAAVIPSMFISYLWHYPHVVIRIIAFAGAALLTLSLLFFLMLLPSIKTASRNITKSAAKLGTIALISFLLKTVFQVLTIVPSLGPLVFANRPVIIGFLHLVLLAFVSLFLLAYFIEARLLAVKGLTGLAVWLFAGGVILNEVVLFTQGLGVMLMTSSVLANWLLLAAAGALFFGALLIAVCNSTTHYVFGNYHYKSFKQFSES